jgi:streptomycin 6-kinase
LLEGVDPEALIGDKAYDADPLLGNPAYRFKRIGLEAGPLSQWQVGSPT